MEDVLVEFVRPWRGKGPGDTARFAPGVADLLCNVSRVARLVPADDAPKPKAQPARKGK